MAQTSLLSRHYSTCKKRNSGQISAPFHWKPLLCPYCFPGLPWAWADQAPFCLLPPQSVTRAFWSFLCRHRPMDEKMYSTRQHPVMAFPWAVSPPQPWRKAASGHPHLCHGKGFLLWHTSRKKRLSVYGNAKACVQQGIWDPISWCRLLTLL